MLDESVKDNNAPKCYFYLKFEIFYPCKSPKLNTSTLHPPFPPSDTHPYNIIPLWCYLNSHCLTFSQQCPSISAPLWCNQRSAVPAHNNNVQMEPHATELQGPVGGRHALISTVASCRADLHTSGDPSRAFPPRAAGAEKKSAGFSKINAGLGGAGGKAGGGAGSRQAEDTGSMSPLHILFFNFPFSYTKLNKWEITFKLESKHLRF